MFHNGIFPAPGDIWNLCGGVSGYYIGCPERLEGWDGDEFVKELTLGLVFDVLPMAGSILSAPAKLFRLGSQVAKAAPYIGRIAAHKVVLNPLRGLGPVLSLLKPSGSWLAGYKVPNAVPDVANAAKAAKTARFVYALCSKLQLRC